MLRAAIARQRFWFSSTDTGGVLRYSMYFYDREPLVGGRSSTVSATDGLFQALDLVVAVGL